MPTDANAALSGTDSASSAHAALFDAVAARKTGRHSEVPLDCTRQPPSRRASFAFFDRWLAAQDLDGRHALDLGCGRGEVSVQIARQGATVAGVDISPESLAKAAALAAHHGVADRIELGSGDAENLPFPDRSFDLAVSAGVMSFVAFDKVAEELARVMKRDGTAVLLDTLGHNPIANLGRRKSLARGRTTQYQVDNVMTANHLDRLRACFGSVEVHVFDIATVPMMLVENVLLRIHPGLLKLTAPVSAFLRIVDRGLLRIRPLRRYAFRIVVVLRWPRVRDDDR